MKDYSYSHHRRLQEEKKQEAKKDEAKKGEGKKEEKKKQEPVKAVCKSIGYFTGENTSKPREIVLNKSGVCSYLEKSCCTDNDFKAIKKWWEGDEAAKSSRQKKRLESDEDIALFTSSLVKFQKEIKPLAEALSKNEKANGECKASANAYVKFDTKGLNNYLDVFEDCAEFVAKLQPTVLCSACDPKFQKTLD